MKKILYQSLKVAPELRLKEYENSIFVLKIDGRIQNLMVLSSKYKAGKVKIACHLDLYSSQKGTNKNSYDLK